MTLDDIRDPRGISETHRDASGAFDLRACRRCTICQALIDRLHEIALAEEYARAVWASLRA